jgi:hypothetical protein
MKYILHGYIDEFLPKNGNRGRIRIDCWEYSFLVAGTNSLIVTSRLVSSCYLTGYDLYNSLTSANRRAQSVGT